MQTRILDFRGCLGLVRILWTDLGDEGVGIERNLLVLDLQVLLLCIRVEPVLLFFRFRQFALDNLVHGVLESVDRGQLVKAFVTAVVLQEGLLFVRSNRRLLVVEVSVRIYDFATLIAPSW